MSAQGKTNEQLKREVANLDQKQYDAKTGQMELEYDALVGRIEAAQQDWMFWDNVLNDHRFSGRMQMLKDEIDGLKEELCMAEKSDDVKRIQSNILARRAVLGMFVPSNYEQPYKAATTAFETFRNTNALFVKDIEVRRGIDRPIEPTPITEAKGKKGKKGGPDAPSLNA